MADKKSADKAKIRYFRLGDKATTFVDPKSGLKIINDEVVEFPHKKARNSQAIVNALAGGHIKEVEAKDHAEYVKTLEKPTKGDKRREEERLKAEAKGEKSKENRQKDKDKDQRERINKDRDKLKDEEKEIGNVGKVKGVS